MSSFNANNGISNNLHNPQSRIEEFQVFRFTRIMQITKVFPRMEFEIVRYAEASHQTWSKKIEKLWKQMKDSRLKKTTSFFLWPGTVSFWPSLIVVLFFPDTLVIKMPYSSKKKSNQISYHILFITTQNF